MSAMPGGVGAAKAATTETQQLIDGVKSQVEGKTNTKYSTFKAIEEATQVVSGINHYVKVQVGESDYIFVKIYDQPWTQTLQVSSVQTGKSATDALGYF